MIHQLYINGSLFETYTNINDVIVAFRDWMGRGFDVRIAFNRALSLSGSR